MQASRFEAGARGWSAAQVPALMCVYLLPELDVDDAAGAEDAVDEDVDALVLEPESLLDELELSEGFELESLLLSLLFDSPPLLFSVELLPDFLLE